MKVASIKNVDFLGRGIAWPFEFSTTKGGVDPQASVTVEEAVDKVRGALLQLLYTNEGERFMLRSFGSKARKLLFEPADHFFVQSLLATMSESIRRWEPRVIVEALAVDRIVPRQGLVQIRLTLRIISVNVVGNLVFPWFTGDPGAASIAGALGAANK